MAEPSSKRKAAKEPIKRRRRSTDTTKAQSFVAEAILPEHRPPGMATSVAQSGGYGPQVVALLQAHQEMTVRAILREVECDENWLFSWLRPPYFFLCPGWKWMITRTGVEAMHASIDPPKTTGAVSGPNPASPTGRNRKPTT